MKILNLEELSSLEEHQDKKKEEFKL